MTATPFLMFQGGRCEDALAFYSATFRDSRIDAIDRYSEEGPGAPGSVRLAHATIAGLPIKAIDSPASHAFNFTPSFSFWIECPDAVELDRVTAALIDGGKALMPPGGYGFSTRFAWSQDRFGVSWQLNFA